jgi:hypothetical protein
MENSGLESTRIGFELMFVGGFSTLRPDGQIKADLRSAQLERAMHPSEVARLHIATHAADGKRGPGFVLDGFQIASIAEFLESQSHVFQAIGAELREEQLLLEDSDPMRSGDVWSYVQIDYILIEPRRVPTPEGLAKMKKWYRDKTLEEIATMHDTPETRSRFDLYLTVAWDDEHIRLARFRDGHFRSFSSE